MVDQYIYLKEFISDQVDIFFEDILKIGQVIAIFLSETKLSKKN